jgi:hypothetical protein
MHCDNIYNLLKCEKYTKLVILKKTRSKIIHYFINRHDIFLMLLEELKIIKNIVIVNFSMYIKLKIFSKPSFILIPKPSIDMIHLFHEELKKIYHNSNNIDNYVDENSLLYNDKYIYYKLYNNVLRQLGFNYIGAYDKIITFCEEKIDVYNYLITNKFFKMPNDLIMYISMFIPYIYKSYEVYKIPQSCKKCYDKYHAGIITYYHMVIGNDTCGLCNNLLSEHLSNAQICPPKYKTSVCGCKYSINCICKTANLTKNHIILQHENKFKN